MADTEERLGTPVGEAQVLVPPNPTPHRTWRRLWRWDARTGIRPKELGGRRRLANRRRPGPRLCRRGDLIRRVTLVP